MGTRCRACNVTVDFGAEYCNDCQSEIWDYNKDLYLEDDENAELNVPPSGDDWDGGTI